MNLKVAPTPFVISPPANLLQRGPGSNTRPTRSPCAMPPGINW